MLHTHSFTYHPHYIMFFSQYFSFPLSVPFHQCPTLIFIYMSCCFYQKDKRANPLNLPKAMLFRETRCTGQTSGFQTVFSRTAVKAQNM